ncbi:MAG: hypothetical protein M1828_005009 [Chrysothrix sp. TS-e1954]|nr:MAG: hypothetical protein M1828_005009 [Chrysothrix sp. TS-e1954]
MVRRLSAGVLIFLALNILVACSGAILGITVLLLVRDLKVRSNVEPKEIVVHGAVAGVSFLAILQCLLHSIAGRSTVHSAEHPSVGLSLGADGDLWLGGTRFTLERTRLTLTTAALSATVILFSLAETSNTPFAATLWRTEAATPLLPFVGSSPGKRAMEEGQPKQQPRLPMVSRCTSASSNYSTRSVNTVIAWAQHMPSRRSGNAGSRRALRASSAPPVPASTHTSPNMAHQTPRIPSSTWDPLKSSPQTIRSYQNLHAQHRLERRRSSSSPSTATSRNGSVRSSKSNGSCSQKSPLSRVQGVDDPNAPMLPEMDCLVEGRIRVPEKWLSRDVAEAPISQKDDQVIMKYSKTARDLEVLEEEHTCEQVPKPLIVQKCRGPKPSPSPAKPGSMLSSKAASLISTKSATPTELEREVKELYRVLYYCNTPGEADEVHARPGAQEQVDRQAKDAVRSGRL